MRRDRFGGLFSNKAVFVSLIASGFLLAACSSEETVPQTPVQTVQATSVGQASQELSDEAGLYAANCQVCHGDSNGIGGTGAAPPHNEKGHTWHHPDAQIREWVTNGKFGLGGLAMPAFGGRLSEREVDSILALIKSWWDPDQRESQADISRRYQEGLDKQKK